MTRLLIADDSPAISQLLARYFARYGYAADLASDGESALAILQSGDLPDLVLADVTMPGLGGAELLRRMRADSRLRDVAVVLMSGADFQPGALGEPEGFQGWLAKPFELEAALTTVRSVLGRAR